MAIARSASVLPPPDIVRVLLSWSLDPLLAAVLVATASLYLLGVRRYNATHPTGRFPAWRPASFLGGLLAIAVALASGIDRYAAVLFSIHMAQHLLLTMVAAPLLLWGRPLFLARRAASPTARRAVLSVLRGPVAAVLTFPVFTWALFAAVMWVSHYSPLYDAALENEFVHGLEHALYLTAALLFWFPVLASEPSRWRLSYPGRILYVFAAMPANTLLGLSLYRAGRLLYSHYAEVARSWGPTPLADQRAGAVVMWLGGDLVMLVTLILLASAWAADERDLGRRLDLRQNQAWPMRNEPLR